MRAASSFEMGATENDPVRTVAPVAPTPLNSSSPTIAAQSSGVLTSRGGRIRTGGLLSPKQAL